MARHASIIALLTVALRCVANGQEYDPAALLALGRSEIVSATENFPRFTCTEILVRHLYTSAGAAITARTNQSAWDLLESFRTGRLAWRDTSSVEVAFFHGAESFDWPGGREFRFADIDSMIGGTSTTGPFGPFIISVFLSDADPGSLHFRRFDSSSGSKLAEYTFRVPKEHSHYLIKAGPDTRIPTAYEGSFWLDPQALLKRLSVQVREAPEQTGVRAASLVVEYKWGRIGGFRGVIPASSALRLLSASGTESIVNASFEACKAFGAESTLLTEDSSHTRPHMTDARPMEPIPAGLVFSGALLTTIDSDATPAGTEVTIRLREALTSADGRLLAPKGAIVVGSVVQIEHRSLPGRVVTFSIRFDHLTANGLQIPIALAALSTAVDYGDFRATPEPQPPPVLRSSLHEEHIASISVFGKTRAQIRKGTLMRWQTR